LILNWQVSEASVLFFLLFWSNYLKDFGVCYWRSNTGAVEIPKFYQARGIYEVDFEQFIEFSLDIRYFGYFSTDNFHQLDGLELCWQSCFYVANQLSLSYMIGGRTPSRLWSVHLSHIGG
jgi:hypothetical protein